MNGFEVRFADHLHDVVDGEVGSVPPTQVVLARGRRGRRRRAVALATASFAVLAVGGIVATSVAPPQKPSPPVAGTQTPQMKLAAAVVASQNISYRVKVTAGLPSDRGSRGTTEGAFDPETATGTLSSTQPDGGNVYQERLVGGVRFTGCSGCGGKWKQYPGKQDRLAYDKALGGVAGSTADPERLFDALRQQGAKITQAGAGSYHFEVVLTGESGVVQSDTLVGDVTLNADKRISKVDYQRTTKVEKKGKTYTDSYLVTVELSGYGTAVKINKPTDVVVVR